MALDNTQIAELIEALGRHGISVNTHELPLDDPHDLLERIIAACHDAADSHQDYQEPEAVAPVLMSHGVIPMAGHKVEVRRPMKTQEAVDAFFEMLPGHGKGKGA